LKVLEAKYSLGASARRNPDSSIATTRSNPDLIMVELLLFGLPDGSYELHRSKNIIVLNVFQEKNILECINLKMQDVRPLAGIIHKHQLFLIFFLIS
jgi:hypothetical protein